jgi:hypothetical protein
MSKSDMMIITTPCWNCRKDMRMAVEGTETGDLLATPSGFGNKERALAERHGVLLREHASATAGDTYLANTCPSCNAFIGEWYIYAHYFCEALYGRLTYQRV